MYFWAHNALRALQLKWTDSSLWLPWATILKTLKWRSAFKENAKAKNCQGKKQKRFSSFLQNLSGASSLCVRDEVFWTDNLIEETYEATSRLVHNCNPYWTRHVCPIEQFSTHSYTSSLRPVLHMLAFGTKMLWMKVPPTPNFRKDLPILKSWRSGTRTSRAKWIQGRRPSQSASESRELARVPLRWRYSNIPFFNINIRRWMSLGCPTSDTWDI